MPFKKGESGNPNGRNEGSKNKKTQQWIEFSEYCLNSGLSKFEKELNKLKGKDFVNAFTNLLEFHKPKLTRGEIKETGTLRIIIEEEIIGDSKKD